MMLDYKVGYKLFIQYSFDYINKFLYRYRLEENRIENNSGYILIFGYI